VGCVFVVDYSVDVAIVRPAVRRSVSGMEVIADGKNDLTGSGGRHGERLKALVIGKAIGDSGKRAAVAADEAGESTVWTVSGAGDVIDAAAAVDGRERAPRGIGGISNNGRRWGSAACRASRRDCTRSSPGSD
jgi:hypothetical protein